MICNNTFLGLNEAIEKHGPNWTRIKKSFYYNDFSFSQCLFGRQPWASNQVLPTSDAECFITTVCIIYDVILWLVGFFLPFFFLSFVDTGSHETRKGKVNYFTTEKFVIMFSCMKTSSDGIFGAAAMAGSTTVTSEDQLAWPEREMQSQLLTWFPHFSWWQYTSTLNNAFSRWFERCLVVSNTR